MQFIKNNLEFTKILRVVSICIYILFFSSVLFSQVTVYDSTRVSIPLKEFAVILFIISSPIIFCFNMRNKELLLTFAFISYSGFLTFVYSFYYHFRIIDGIYYPLITGYLYIYFIGIIISQVILVREFPERFFKIGFSILCFNSYIGLFLYVIYFVGLNPIMLGVNHSATFRAFGLMTEPSHFSVISCLTFLLYIYFVYEVKYFKLSKIKLFMLGLAFILSQSPIGFIFFTLCLIMYSLRFNLINKILLLLILILIYLSMEFLIEIDTIQRGFNRVKHDILLLLFFWENNNDLINNFDNYSRAGRLLELLPVLDEISFIEFLTGMGLGGQNLILPSTNSYFPGPLYLMIEIGLIGMLILISIFLIAFNKALNLFFWLIIPYIIICFFNPPGGIFGFQFLVFIFFLGLASNVSLKK